MRWAGAQAGLKGPSATTLRLLFNAVVGVSTVTYLHGAGAAFVAAIAAAGYATGRLGAVCARRGGASRPLLLAFEGASLTCAKRVATGRGGGAVAFALSWVFCVVVLVLVEYRRHWFSFATVAPAYRHLDRWDGVYGWHSAVNLLLLRIVSFNLDRCGSPRAIGRPADPG